MEENPITVLLIEDEPGHAEVVKDLLRARENGGFDPVWEQSLSSGLKRLEEGGIDVILLDLSLPDSRGLETFLKVHAHSPETPVVVLTGHDDESLAIGAVRRGAQDYLVKVNVDPELLARSLRYAIERARLVNRLQTALSQIHALHGLLPICTSCKNIRDDKGYWQEIETYIRRHSDADFTHSICPKCIEKLYPGLHKSDDSRQAQ